MEQTLIVLAGVFIPFLGTCLGSGCVFLMKGQMNERIQKILLGFASGVMVSASVFSLLIPAMENASSMGKLSFFPAAVGTAAGMLFLLLLDSLIPHLHMDTDKPEGLHSASSRLSRTMMLCLAVTLHNIPEGMAPGVVFAGALSGTGGVTLASALALSLGIAIQNFPEGAIISMPLASEGKSKTRAFLLGTLSGAVEPIAALLTIALTGLVSTALPYLLSFAAGAMLYVVVEELIPEASIGNHSNHGTMGFGFGFILMMVLDVALG
ncbi:MAG: ZIP family metal transporter [Eubacterium sp.]|nr:ZIP family metal transporter [Eubacterium sp.]